MTIVAIPCLDVFADEINTNEVVTNNQRDLYSEEFNETVSIEGVGYTYSYYYNENGDRSISILNNEKSTVETISYNESSSNIYLNDEKIV